MHVPAVQFKYSHNKTSSLFQKAMNLRAKQTRRKNWQGKGNLRTPTSHWAAEAQDYDVTLVNGSHVSLLAYIGIGLHLTCTQGDMEHTWQKGGLRPGLLHAVQRG